MNKAYYFGCILSPGHFLWDKELRKVRYTDLLSIPWKENEMDTALLKGLSVKDVCDGKVFSVAHGSILDAPFWFAFVWWDRSVDHRGNSNSGFYVYGFMHNEKKKAFNFARKQFPSVVDRQLIPLELQP